MAIEYFVCEVFATSKNVLNLSCSFNITYTLHSLQATAFMRQMVSKKKN